MKVKKHPQLNLNLAIPRTLPLFRPLATLFVFLSVSSSAAGTASLPQTTTPRTFADWCLNQANLSVQTQRTVDVLLRVAKTTDCNQASSLLSTRTELSLKNNKITDLTPLSGLTNLAALVLDNNQIADLSPLSGLTNLTALSLVNNQIANLTPLSGLTNLKSLYLDKNQIASLSPLSGLTNLIGLNLASNQIASLSPLSELTNLIDLLLAFNQITDLTPLSRLTNLAYIQSRFF